MRRLINTKGKLLGCSGMMLASFFTASSVVAEEGDSGAGESWASSNNFKLGGYVRAWASFNLKDVPDTPHHNDQGELSMLRGSILLDADAKLGASQWKAIVRADREMKTNYMERLEELNRVKAGGISSGGPGQSVMDQYNRTDLREFYVDLEPSDRLKLRLGKQQVVWGESDFFRAMDLVHGYDLRWRSFLEGENEELRKPLILANATVQVPEVDGSLQVIVRPGLDRERDIGNSYDLYGGRWDLQTFKGSDFLSQARTMRYDFHHTKGDVDDVTGGVRWKQTVGGVSYSLAYLETFNPDPIVNSAFAPWKSRPTSPFGDWIFPKIQLIGVTLNGYVPAIDSVLSGEFVFTKDAPYNVGLSIPGSKFQPYPYGTANTIAGFGGVKLKDTVTSMVRFDKNLDLKSMLGTGRDSFFSMQLFDKWILNYKKSDEIVDIVGYNARKKEHTSIMTVVLVTNYANDTINPSLAGGVDLSNGGGFLIPGVDFVLSDKWRLKVEADLFFPKDTRKASINSVTGLSETDTHLFGALANDDQLMVRLTRLF